MNRPIRKLILHWFNLVLHDQPASPNFQFIQDQRDIQSSWLNQSSCSIFKNFGFDSFTLLVMRIITLNNEMMFHLSICNRWWENEWQLHVSSFLPQFLLEFSCSLFCLVCLPVVPVILGMSALVLVGCMLFFLRVCLL